MRPGWPATVENTNNPVAACQSCSKNGRSEAGFRPCSLAADCSLRQAASAAPTTASTAVTDSTTSPGAPSPNPDFLKNQLKSGFYSN